MLTLLVKRAKRKAAAKAGADFYSLETKVDCTIDQLIAVVVGYPNIFEGKVPRTWIQIIATPLADLLVDLEVIGKDRRLALLVAEYHVNSWVGLVQRHSSPNRDALRALAKTQLSSTLHSGNTDEFKEFYWALTDEMYQ